MLKKYLKKFFGIISFCLLFASFGVASIAGAGTAGADLRTQLQTAGGSWGGAEPTGSASLTGIVGIVIQALLGLLGIIFLVLIIYAGYNWMTAAGDEEKVTKAKDTLQRAVIGLIIVVAANAITWWVIHKLVEPQLNQ